MLITILISKRKPGSRGVIPRILQLCCDHCNIVFEIPYCKGKISRTFHFCKFACSQAARGNGGVLRPIMEETMRRKMGDDWAKQIRRKAHESQTSEQRKVWAQKAKQTVLERYGANSACQIPHVRKSCLEKGQTSEAKAKRKATTLAHFGVESVLSLPQIHHLANTPEACLKRHETMVRNGTYFTSRPEERCYELLCEKFGSDDVFRQVWMNRWPIDFYIESIDTYVQEDGVYLHGLNRPIELIAERRTEKDRQIHEKWLTDRRQDAWFLEKNKRLIRITDEQVKRGEINL